MEKKGGVHGLGGGEGAEAAEDAGLLLAVLLGGLGGRFGLRVARLGVGLTRSVVI
jgi:hypothetical protein